MSTQEELKALREKAGLSRDKVAQMCGITSQTIYRAEKNGKITLTNYLKITKTLKDAINNLVSSL